MKIKWKPIIEVSTAGQLRVIGGRVICSRSATRGYQHIDIERAVHRLVASAFCDRPKNATIVHHIDGNPRNNDASNLEWVTQSENCQRLSPKPRKLGAKQVAAILALKPAHNLSLKEMAAKHGVTVSATSALRSGRTWNGQKRSSGGGNTKLSANAVAEIRGWKKPSPSATHVAKQFKVSKTTVLNIWNGMS